MNNKAIKQGIYQHFKGNKYQVFGLCQYKGEDYVLYQKLYDDYSFWIRPYDMFFEVIQRESKKMPRFKFVKESIPEMSLCVLKAFHSETLEVLSAKFVDGFWIAE